MPNADELLDPIRRRINRYIEDGDASGLEPMQRILAEGQALIVGSPKSDPAPLYAVAMVHWCRYLALPEDATGPDLKYATKLFGLAAQRGATPPAEFAELRDADPGLRRRAHRALTALPRLVRTGDRDGRAEVGVTLGEVAAGLPVDHPSRGVLLTARATAMYVDDPEAAIEVARVGAGLLPDGHPGRGAAFGNLARMLHARWEQTRDRDLLDEAGRWAEAAWECGPRDHVVLHGLAVVWWDLSDEGKNLAALNRAIEVAGEDQVFRLRVARVFKHFERDDAVATLELARRVGTADLAASIARLIFDHTGETGFLDAAIETATGAGELSAAYRERARLTGSAADANDAVRLAHEPAELSAAYRERYELFGDPADVEAAVTFGEQSGESAPLAAALQARYEQTGSLADLNTAIDCGRAAAIARTTATPGATAAIFTNLGSALARRHERLGAAADQDDAIDAMRAAVAEARDPRYLINLALALISRYERTDDPDDLNGSIAAAQEALDTAPDSARGNYRTTLALGWWRRYQREPDPELINRAVDLAREAAAETPAGHISRTAVVANLATILQNRGTAQDIDEAIAILRSGPPSLTLQLNLGNALRRRHERTHSPAAIDEALGCWRVVAESPLARPWARLAAARQWGEFAVRLGDHELAVTGYEIAVAQLPLLAWRGIRRDDQERLLTQWRGLAGDAAAAAILAGRPDRAVELLEQGRGILWAHLLETRTDPTRLAAAHPGLARELDDVRARLDTATGKLEDLMKAATRWTELVAAARRLPGFEDFLAPPALPKPAGQIVVVNLSVHRCDALVLTPDAKVQVIPLPGLTLAEADRRALAYLRALSNLTTEELQVRREFERTIDEALRWLWDTVAGPVLTVLDHTPTDTELPRLWWSPTGSLTHLPLHGAGHHAARDGRTVLDRVVSSYAPTLRSLAANAAPPRTHHDDDRLLFVAPNTPGQQPLPGSAVEQDTITTLLPTRTTVLTDTAAARHEVLTHLTDHAWAHFSCHGGQDLNNPSHGGLHLHDGMLTVAELTTTPHRRGEFVFLAACQTATGGLANPDETITLTAALQHAGWRHVIGTLWTVRDDATTRVTQQVYATLVTNGHLDPTHTARALHAATRSLRGTGRVPSRWVQFLHIGP